jgi:signal transduction histidine kinase
MHEELSQRLMEAEAKLEVLRSQLLESQRLATIGTIASVIAHEFNNLLTPIVSYCQVAAQSLSSGSPDIELIGKALSRSQTAAEKAGRICSSMLGLARGESHSGRVSVRELVDDTLLVLARDPQKDGIALRVQVPPGLNVRGDPVQLQQVLLNLLINARQAMIGRGSGGSLTVKAQETDQSVKIQVIDTGPGIPKDLIHRIFEPFFTTKGKSRPGEPRGTGLGLAICREIIEQHNGRIDVESTLGQGTCFSIELPACREN